jgi:hypothetical protein
LDRIYKLKEKWAGCYMKNVFTLGMKSTQLSESLNNDLKIHFKSNFDIIRLFKHFERVVQGKRNNKLDAKFDSRKKLPKLCIHLCCCRLASYIHLSYLKLFKRNMKDLWHCIPRLSDVGAATCGWQHAAMRRPPSVGRWLGPRQQPTAGVGATAQSEAKTGRVMAWSKVKTGGATTRSGSKTDVGLQLRERRRPPTSVS